MGATEAAMAALGALLVAIGNVVVFGCLHLGDVLEFHLSGSVLYGDERGYCCGGYRTE